MLTGYGLQFPALWSAISVLRADFANTVKLDLDGSSIGSTNVFERTVRTAFSFNPLPNIRGLETSLSSVERPLPTTFSNLLLLLEVYSSGDVSLLSFLCL